MGKFQNIIGDVIVSPPARCQFIALEKPDSGRQYSDDKYKVTLLFDKENTDFAEMQEAILKTAQMAWGDKTEIGDLDLIPFKDGDEDRCENWAGFPGNIFLCAKSKYPVHCIDSDGKTAITPKEIYNGCLIRCALVPMAYESGRDRGVTFLLNFVQLLEKLGRLGGLGDVDPADLFGKWDEKSDLSSKPSKAKTSNGAQKPVEDSDEDDDDDVDDGEEEAVVAKTPPVATAKKKRGRPAKAAVVPVAKKKSGSKKSGANLAEMLS